MADSSEEINQILNNKTQPPGTFEAGNRDASVQKQSRPSSANRELQKEREERIKQMKERQNEERQKKLEELKAQALAAQKFRELKEEERRRRMDDLRRRDCDRRSQVEERRRAIIEADNERREYILRKNQERDQRMETKRRNDRGSIQFAFGSSTPRMIDTSDSGMCSSFWSNRRATSITNVAYVGAALTRRSSERELTDSASKKRATSASGLDRSTDGLRSGEMTPTSLNTSRPGSAMSSSTTASGIVYRRSLPAQRKPRPASIAVTGVTATGLKEEKPPLPKTGSGASTGSSVNSASIKHRLSSAGSGSINTTPAKSSSSTETPTKKPLTLHSAEKRATGVRVATPKASSTPLQSPGPEKASRNLQDALKKASEVTKKPPVSEKTQPKQSILKSDIVTVEENQEEPSVLKAEEPTVESEKVQDQAEGSLLVSLVEVEPSFGQDEQPQQQQEEVVVPVQQEAPLLVDIPMEYTEVPKQVAFAAVEEEQSEEVKEPELDQQDVTVSVPSEVTVTAEDEMLEVSNGNLSVDGVAVMGDAMTASMIAKRINTEEEAKAALAERRRLAREEAERQAELERKRIEAEEQAERQRVLEEEERLRKLEEETIRLAEEQRRMEDERLQQAIEEARRRDEEERKRREEEARQKAEREEAERKAREEAERLRVEMAERLKKEEKEREERRKRVEAIMSRTRTKGTANNTPTKNNEDDRENAMSKSQIVLSSKPAVLPTGTAMSASTISMTDSFIASELRQEQQQHQSLDQAMESLSLSNNNNSSSNGSNSNSSSSSETLANSTNINNNINNNSTNGSSMQQFEKSVTEKENLLLVDSTTSSSMVSNNNLNNGSASNGTVVELTPNEQGTNGESIIPTTNGKTEQPSVMMATSNGSTVNTTANSTSDLIIEDALMGQTNGHKNGSMDNVLNGNDSEHPKSHKESTEAAVLLESNDLLVSNTGDHLLHGGDPETILSFADTANTAGDHQQHSSFDSSATISTVTTESTIVTGDSAGSNAYQLIDFASFSTSDEPENIQLREGIISDANFNPLTPFGMPEAESAETTQHLALDLHNLSNNNSINPFFTSDEHATLPVSRCDGSNRDPSGNIVPEAALFNLGFDSTSTTSTSSTFFNNNNTTSPNNTPWMVSATSDGQDKRDLSLL